MILGWIAAEIKVALASPEFITAVKCALSGSENKPVEVQEEEEEE